MSSTRRAKDDSIFQQTRYASSPEFERGLIANLVAKRCQLLPDDSDRQMVWFLQKVSHEAGGIPALAKELMESFCDRLQTAAMIKIGMKPGKICDAGQVKAIREEIPLGCGKFLLKGENDTIDLILSRDWGYYDQSWAGGSSTPEAKNRAARAAFMAVDSEIEAKAGNYPSSYPAQTFLDLCREEAASSLENHLCEICLNPKIKLEAGPWYFPSLITTLREYQAGYIQKKSAGSYTTALGQKVCDVLDYTVHCRGLTLIQGEARLGKSHAARVWCAQHPGNARFVEVPDGNDDASFFRDIAQAIGLGSFLNYKVVQIRERIESVLRTGDITLVLDEAQRLWPQTHFRAGYPKRMVWVMTMANAGVPICMVSTPQFFATQKIIEKNGWNSAQLTGRISHYESLPADLSPADLMAVAKAVLPEADTQSLRALAVYARSSARYLAAIDSISKRARYIAMRAGRAAATTEDVRKAMQESVIPADTKLHRALDATAKGKLAKLTPAPVMPMAPAEIPAKQAPDDEEILPACSRLAPIATAARNRAGNPASLVEA